MICHIRCLVEEMNSVFSDEASRPSWMIECTDSVLKTAACYRPEVGRGVLSEVDWGNNAGSVLFFFAERVGLRCFGHRDGMLVPQSGFASSGRGACNRRTN